MSKIEKALSRARVDKSLALVPTAAPTSVNDSGHDLIKARQIQNDDPELHANASKAIARMREKEIRNRDDLAAHRIIHPEVGGSEIVQAFREIRTKILQRTKGHNGVIMVTPVNAGGGGTFIALNLGAAFAFDTGKTALLVDCNLARPSLDNLLKGEPPLGLTDYLDATDIDVSEIIHPVGIERLRLIPAGKRRDVPGEHFTSPRIKRLLDNIRRRYVDRYVILDAPSIKTSADARILAELCDFVLLVVPYGMANQSQIDECIKSVDGDKFLGVVFNNEPRFPDLDWRDVMKESIRIATETLKAAPKRAMERALRPFKKARAEK